MQWAAEIRRSRNGRFGNIHIADTGNATIRIPLDEKTAVVQCTEHDCGAAFSATGATCSKCALNISGAPATAAMAPS